MLKDDDPKTTMTALLERRKLLKLLVSEYDDRLKYDNLRDEELDHSIEELRALKTQIHLIDSALADLEDKREI
jgi:hypothetical protein